MNNYQKYCKPTLAAALHSVGLDYTFHRAAGQYLYYRDTQGEERAVLDFLGGYGAVILGHNEPELTKVLMQQIEQGVAFHNQFSLRASAGNLAARLNTLLPKETGWNENFICAFASTGAESVEVALKHAEVMRGKKLDQIQDSLPRTLDKIEPENAVWNIPPELAAAHPQLITTSCQEKIAYIKQWNQHKLNQAPMYIALKHAFHGKLNMSIQLTYGEMYRHPFRRLGLNARFFSPAELTEDRLQQLKSQEQAYVLETTIRRGEVSIDKADLPFIAGILVEPVQGEGGCYCLDKADAKALHDARRILDCPLISDEVQSGCGRCGTFLAGSQIGLKPDYVVLSKGLGGGISKIGVVAIRESQYATGFDLIQSSTFGEDEWSACVADTFVRKITENNGALLDQIKQRGDTLGRALNALQVRHPDIIKEVRGKGLLYGIEFASQHHSPSVLIKTTAYQEAIGYLVTGHLLVKHGIRVAPPASAGNVIRIEPSIQLADEDIQQLTDALDKVCVALRYQDTGYILSYLLDAADNINTIPVDYRACYEKFNIVKAQGKADAKVAFINHLISSEWIKDVEPALIHLTNEQAETLLNRLSYDRRVAPFAPVRIRSTQGQTVDFTLYPINATSQQIGELLATNNLGAIREAVDERLAAARDDGCTIAGLGMFTSIITNNGKAVETSGIKLTTGNALTVAMAAEAIQESISQRKKGIKHAAIIGAAGNIGSVYSTLIAEYCPSLILVGRVGSVKRIIKTAELVYQTSLHEMSKSPDSLNGLAKALLPFALKNEWLSQDFLQQKNIGKTVYAWFEQFAPSEQLIKVSEDLNDIQQADLLVCAANSSESFIEERYLQKDVLVCDIAVPHNISEDLLNERPDICCLRGGIVSTPHSESLDLRARAYLGAGQVYACMAETIVLGLENYNSHYSYGNIDKHQVKKIMGYATSHGLALAGNKETESM
ncbi:MAG: 4-aminobutyrate aminotransferase-like enzyme/predicted amino acid dehydrogenase [Cellvibrionaceae bacterium]|jgi:4-aminobutyrate aminotransferase-like enzyme/predicted amino acid dehydrogenase